MEDFLWKKGEKGLMKGYKRRWFVIGGDGHLRYYEDPSQGKLLGDIDVSRCTRVSRGDSTKHKGKVRMFAANVFEVEVPGRVYTLIPETPAQLEAWVGALGAHADASAFRGDLRRIAAAGTSGASVPRPPAAAPPAAYEAPAAVRPSTPAEIDDGVTTGPGPRSGGFFARLGGASEPSAAKIRELEDNYARTQTEVTVLRQELDAMRREGGAGRRKGAGATAGPLGRSLLAPEDEEEGRDDADEPEILPGCGFCGGRCTCKVFFLVLVNIVVIVTGIAAAAGASYALVEKSEYSALVSSVAVYVLLGVGVGFMLVGVVGSYAATRFNTARGKCLLLLYVVFMTVLALSELLGGVALIVTAKGLKAPGQAAEAQAEITKALDKIYVSCCNTTAAHRSEQDCAWLPDTVTSGCPNVDAAAFDQRVLDVVSSEVLPIGGVAAGLFVVHAAAVWFTATLICSCCGKCCSRGKGSGDADGDGKGRGRSRSRAGSERRRRRSSAYDDDFD